MSAGLFWEDVEVVRKTRGDKGTRQVNVPVPDTGWGLPREFIDFRDDEYLAVDVETFDPELQERGPGWAFKDKGHLLGISFASAEHGKVYYPMRHPCGNNLPVDEVLDYAREQLSREHQPKLFAQALYDFGWLHNEGVGIAGPCFDVAWAEALLDENVGSYSLDAIAARRLGETKTTDLLYRWIRDSFGERVNPRAYIYKAPSKLVGPYAEDDAALLIPIFRQQLAELESQGLLPLFEEVEAPLVGLLHAMRKRGVRVDVRKVEELHARLTAEVTRLSKSIGVASVWAPDELAIAASARGLRHPMTPTGKPSFQKEWLGKNWPEVARARVLDKVASTFVRGYILERHDGGRIHCQFHPLRSDDGGTVSGRFSSSDPNLQNIPIRDEEVGPLIRSVFVPDEEDDTWTRFDYSQIEFRLLVSDARGKGAQRARDMYRTNPDTDFHVYAMNMTGLERKPAKNINFGLVYGMSESTMAYNLGRPLEEVEPLFATYHAEMPFVKETYNYYSRLATRQGFITTVLDRRRRFDLWETKDWEARKGTPALRYEAAVSKFGAYDIRRAGTHKALNSRLQGGAADIMKRAMVLIWQSGICDVLGAPLLTVHDELDWSTQRHNKQHQEALAEAKHIMETCVEVNVPLVADMEQGNNWGDAS